MEEAALLHLGLVLREDWRHIDIMMIAVTDMNPEIEVVTLRGEPLMRDAQSILEEVTVLRQTLKVSDLQLLQLIIENVLYVGDLSPNTKAEELWKVFSRHGEVSSCDIVSDPIT